MCLMDEEVNNWDNFWGMGQHVLFSLGSRLDDAGFGLNESKKAERKKQEEKGNIEPKK